MTQSQQVEDFQEKVRPAPNLNRLDEFQQLFADGCQFKPDGDAQAAENCLFHWKKEGRTAELKCNNTSNGHL